MLTAKVATAGMQLWFLGGITGQAAFDVKLGQTGRDALQTPIKSQSVDVVQNDLKNGSSEDLGDAKAYLSGADHADVDNAHNVLLFIALRRPS